MLPRNALEIHRALGEVLDRQPFVAAVVLLLGYLWSIGTLDKYMPAEVMKKSHYVAPGGTNVAPAAATAPAAK